MVAFRFSSRSRSSGSWMLAIGGEVSSEATGGLSRGARPLPLSARLHCCAYALLHCCGNKNTTPACPGEVSQLHSLGCFLICHLRVQLGKQTCATLQETLQPDPYTRWALGDRGEPCEHPMDITHLLIFWVTRSLPDGIREQQIVVGNPNLNTKTLNTSKKKVPEARAHA